MTMNLPKLIPVAVLAWLAASLPLKAEPIYAANVLLSSGTITNSTTRTLTGNIDVSKQATVGVMVSFAMVAGAETGNVVTTFQRSIDGSTWETTGTAVTTASNGTNSVNVLTKVDSNGAQFVRVLIANTNNTNNATATVKYCTKISAP